jgi:hypothetical protein
MTAPAAAASAAAGGVSAYEQRRLANIARNEAALLELGLLGAAPDVEAARAARAPRAPARRERREPGVPQRASARLAALPPPDIKEEPDLDVLDRAIERGGRGRKRARVVGSGSGSGAAEEQDEVPEPDEAGAGVGGSGALAYSVEAVAKCGLRESSGGEAGRPRSSKEIAARVGDADGAWVGKILLPPEGSGALKEAAMVALGVQRPRFSKYSGIQEFSNSVVLFVNAAPPGLSPEALKQPKYVNTFFRERAQGPWLMPWFAQARHTAETPVIERLQGRVPVLLMCRIPGQAYVCCGRLELREKALERSPIRIVWALTRSEQLDQGSEAWAQLLAFSGCQPVAAQQVKPEVQLA